MSAKPAKKSAARNTPAPADPVTPAPAPTPAASTTATEPAPSWLDSPDPRKRKWARVILAGVCLYVAALWLLALDRTLDLGIFGPKAATELKLPAPAKS